MTYGSCPVKRLRNDSLGSCFPNPASRRQTIHGDAGYGSFRFRSVDHQPGNIYRNPNKYVQAVLGGAELLPFSSIHNFQR